MEPASSVTHQHILSVIVTTMKRKNDLRILDAGCGSGTLMRYLSQGLRELMPGGRIEVCGFDVDNFSPHGTRDLASGIQVVQSGQVWPYPDASFDVVVSNQVLEHVADHAFFFRELWRVLTPKGISVHLFPVKEYIYEGHVFIPLAHRIPVPVYINAMARIGFMRKQALLIPGTGDFGIRVVNYIKKYTTYLSRRRLVRIAKSAGLRPSFDYTPHFYAAKLRSMLGMQPRYFYSHNSLVDYLAFLVLRYVSSITLILRH
jgi:SAM-dependent methyltransferase